MKKLLLALTLIVGGAAHAAPLVFNLVPSGSLTGAPGQTIGWGYEVQADPTDWISFTGSQILTESQTNFGLYLDFLGAPNTPGANNLAPGSYTSSLEFDNALGTGLGAYTISPLVQIGDFNEGTLLVLFERYSADPEVCGSACLLGSDYALLDFTVDAQVPEPASIALVGGSLVLLGVVRARRLKGRV